MVLAELGEKIRKAFEKLSKKTTIDEEAVDECLTAIANALMLADVNFQLIKKLKENIKMQFKLNEGQGTNLRKLIQGLVVQELTHMLDPGKKPFHPKKGKSNVIMFVGLQGSGKTTTCAKYAHYWQNKGWRTALVCADTFRAGAFDQLKQNATKIKTETDPVQIAKEGVDTLKKDNYEIIIVDTSGKHKQAKELFEEMKQIESAINPDDVIFVMDSTIGQACFAQAQAFKQAVKVGSVIITKLDSSAKGGGALSAVAATESPIVFIGTGEHFSDFEEFDASSFIKRLLGLGDISKLFNTVKNVVNLDDQQTILEEIKSGHFTLRSLQTQFQSILKVGSLNQFMSMIPGMGTGLLSKGNEKESIARIKKFLFIMDSMTNDELDLKQAIKESRIAKGSGTTEKTVTELMEEFKRIKNMIEKVGKANLGRGNEMVNLMRNPNQVMKKMQNCVDPKLVSSLGGMGNIMNMMKEMGKMEGMEDMMKSMKGPGKKKHK